MSQPYIGEIRCFGFQFAPVNWAFCNGQSVAISDNTALYSILGTTYGGDGVNTFALPNLQGRAPMHWGSGPGGFNTVIGEVQGAATVTVTTQQIPSHTHTITAAAIPSGGVVDRIASPNPNAFIADSAPNGVYNKNAAALESGAPFAASAIGTAGGSQPHDNMQPYLALNFCIALFGIYPSRN